MRGWQRKPPVKERRLLKCLQHEIKKEERYKKSSGYVLKCDIQHSSESEIKCALYPEFLAFEFSCLRRRLISAL